MTIPTTVDDVRRMTERSIKQRFYLALHYPVASQSEMLAHMQEHLDYMAAHEDRVFLSGPLVQEDVVVGEGLTILKTDNEVQARELMDGEPLIKRGLRRYELKLWRIQEGTMSMSISGTSSSVTLG